MNDGWAIDCTPTVVGILDAGSFLIKEYGWGAFHSMGDGDFATWLLKVDGSRMCEVDVACLTLQMRTPLSSDIMEMKANCQFAVPNNSAKQHHRNSTECSKCCRSKLAAKHPFFVPY